MDLEDRELCIRTNQYKKDAEINWWKQLSYEWQSGVQAQV